MGFFDRLTGRKEPSAAARHTEAKPADLELAAAGGVLPQLAAARDQLDAKDLPGALAIYEEVLAAAGDRADVLVTISGDLGATGHLREIIDLVAPRYDAERHGPAVGLNLIQAYLALRDADGAQHVLDILFTLNRSELEDRLHGFSNAIADLIAQDVEPLTSEHAAAEAEAAAVKIDITSISKPIWFYGLEPLAAQILPEKSGRLRRVAFAQLSILGVPDLAERIKQPEDDLSRLSRALPLWLSETFYFSANYSPFATVGIVGKQYYALFGFEWTPENLRQLADSTQGGLDFVFTGALRPTADGCELLLRLWETKKYRERKQFTTRWTPATADAELSRLHEQIRTFMEWSPEKTGLAYAPPASPLAWLRTLASSLSLFMVEKEMMPRERLAPTEELLAPAIAGASSGEAASLAFLSARNRAERLELAARLDAVLATSPLITQATGLPARSEASS